MSTGGALHRRRICVSGTSGVADAVRALAETQGHTVVDFDGEGPTDLMVVDGHEVHPLQVTMPDIPILVVTAKRLKPSAVAELIRSGADRVLDRDANLLDLAFAFSDLLFQTRVEQRRYANQNGGVVVEVASPTSAPGRLVCVARCGALLMTDERLADGTRVEMRFELAHRPIALRGRVAYTAECHVGIEFALDDVEVAPKLGLFLEGAAEASPLGTASVSM